MKRYIQRVFFMMALMAGGQWTAANGQAAVSPLDYGLREATTGIGRYYALYNAHSEARDRGLTVSYAGIDSIDIELPPAWRALPLAPQTDFGGLVLTVTNRYRHGALFSMTNQGREVRMDKAMVDGLDFGSVPELAEGCHLLVLTDETPWTERQGYGYKAYRKDIIVVVDGRGQNSPVARWDTEATRLRATVYDVDTTQKVFRNLTMHRTKESTYKTYCLSVSGQLNVLIDHVYVTTPKSRMIADGVFSIGNSACVHFADDTVRGTYSGYGRWRDYGYAFSLNNLYATRFDRTEASGNWGVFGTNNLNDTRLEDCSIDRFDIHCYGRDAYLKRCELRGRQTTVTSFYGTVVLDSCRMIDYTPVAVRASYNAYPPFDAVIRDCTFELTRRQHALVCVNLEDTATNPREELREKCWPNLTVERLTVVAPWTVGGLDVFKPQGNERCLDREYGHLERVSIKGLRTVRPGGREVKLGVRLSAKPFKTKKELKYTTD
ncbi:MAG: hypothetical protein IKC19_06950 [Bacteroidales bacterium]|nr:hypothetical protein [Bacteroidales bacterium]